MNAIFVIITRKMRRMVRQTESEKPFDTRRFAAQKKKGAPVLSHRRSYVPVKTRLLKYC